MNRSTPIVGGGTSLHKRHIPKPGLAQSRPAPGDLPVLLDAFDRAERRSRDSRIDVVFGGMGLALVCLIVALLA